LAPARRVLLLLALTLFIFSTGGEHGEHGEHSGGWNEYAFLGVLILFLLLVLELADKVIMKRDLEIAREIQSWLVPSQPPDVLNADVAFATRPQNSVAGDYYDAFYANPEAPGGGKLMLVIADVAGKSVPAALLMATFQASLRTIAGEGVPLAALVARLNRYSSAHSLDGLRFTTAVLAEYDPESRRLIYVNAGHNAPILRRATGAIELLEAGGVPLGIDASAAFETGTTDLNSGDLLIFFTDGVVEAVNQAGDEYGNQRWLDAISVLPMGNAQTALLYLMKGVDDYVGTTRQTDDITYLIFKSR
jgi:phosphoserine phosphatase RsbU/P